MASICDEFQNLSICFSLSAQYSCRDWYDHIGLNPVLVHVYKNSIQQIKCLSKFIFSVFLAHTVNTEHNGKSHLAIQLSFALKITWWISIKFVLDTHSKNIESRALLAVSHWFLAWPILQPWIWGNIFLQNVSWLSVDYTGLYRRRQKLFITTTLQTLNSTQQVFTDSLCTSSIMY
jgi:hypothetical protein